MEHEKRVFLILKVSTILIFTGRGVREFSDSTIPYIGIIFLASAFLLIFNWKNKVSIYFSSISSIFLIFHSVVNLIKHQWIAEQFIEHGIQLGVPVLFTILHLYKIRLNKLKITLKILIALTFVGHGLFALGAHYVPNHFIEMTKFSLSFSSDQSITFLSVMGTMDLIVALLIFFSWKNQSICANLRRDLGIINGLCESLCLYRYLFL